MKRVFVLVVGAAVLGAAWVMAQPAEVSLIDRFRTVEVASVSDAMEQLYGERADYSRFCAALTALLEKSWAERPADLKRLDLKRDLPLTKDRRQRLHPLLQRRTVNLVRIQRRQSPTDPSEQPSPYFRIFDLANFLP